MSRFSNQRTAIGNYPSLRSVQNRSAISFRNPLTALQTNRNNQPTQQSAFLQQLRWEWQRNGLSTEILDRIQGIVNVLQTEEGRTQAKRIVNGFSTVMNKLPLKEAVNTVSKDLNLGDLLKSLGENGNSAELLQNMMNNPEMKQTAMDMMQQMMGDEKKMAEMTEMMAKMLNPDKK